MTAAPFTLLFPGQGTEAVGMSAPWVADEAWNATLEAAERHTGYTLRKLMAEGPLESLRFQRHAPCAVLSHSVGLYRAHRAAGMPVPAAATGHSMGFFSAVVASGVAPLEAALDLITAVEEESEARFGAKAMGMAFVIGLAETEVQAALMRHPELALSNRNGKAQFTVSGPKAALEALVAELKPSALKCGLLPVQHPLHGPHMVPLVPAVARRLARVMPAVPAFPLISHFDGRPLWTGAEIWDEAIASPALPVDWLRVVATLKVLDAPLAECGFGGQLTGLTRWADRDLTVRSLQNP
ncbi:MAG TPA: ACP S-malonyltransferase [Holophagaceae bacterium]|jgi:[acyl-carrier-protein] S-malonyltransferase|nr:ACP S-malonyltransferase [Holophagaceae bacterium]